MIAENDFYEILIQSIGPKFQHFRLQCLVTKLIRTSGPKYAIAKNIQNLTSRSVSGIGRTDPPPFSTLAENDKITFESKLQHFSQVNRGIKQ